MTHTPPCLTGRVRLTEFWRLMEDEFGPARARMLADHQSLTSLGSVPASVAIARGESLKQVWRAMCAEMNVPQERWFGKDRPIRRG